MHLPTSIPKSTAKSLCNIIERLRVILIIQGRECSQIYILDSQLYVMFHIISITISGSIVSDILIYSSQYYKSFLLVVQVWDRIATTRYTTRSCWVISTWRYCQYRNVSTSRGLIEKATDARIKIATMRNCFANTEFLLGLYSNNQPIAFMGTWDRHLKQLTYIHLGVVTSCNFEKFTCSFW